jgi:hypothetical protein
MILANLIDKKKAVAQQKVCRKAGGRNNNRLQLQGGQL